MTTGFEVGKYYRLKDSFIEKDIHKWFCDYTMKGNPKQPRKLIYCRATGVYDYRIQFGNHDYRGLLKDF